MLARIRQILTNYDDRYEQLYLDDTTVRYNCNIVALSLTNAEEIERKIDSIEKKIDSCPSRADLYKKLLSLETERRDYLKIALKYGTRLPKEQYEAVLEHVYN